ncbi:MAG: SRPBCC family protein [Candidatus Limnocylindrales bacterium]
MATITAAVELPHPVEVVFRVATRIPDLPRWLPEVVAAELLDPELAVGSRVRLKLGPAAGGAEITGTVKELMEPSTLVIAGSGGPLQVRVQTRLEALGDATTLITLELGLSAPPFLGFIAKEAERRIAAELPGAMERFRALMDAEPG